MIIRPTLLTAPAIVHASSLMRVAPRRRNRLHTELARILMMPADYLLANPTANLEEFERLREQRDAMLAQIIQSVH